MMGEMEGFDSGAVVGINVVAPKAKAYGSAGGEVGAAALAVGRRLLALFGQDAEVDLYCTGLDFRRQAILLSMFDTRTKLNRAIAMVVALHGQPADATAGFVAAFVFMPCHVTPVLVHQFSSELVAWRFPVTACCDAVDFSN